MAKDKELVIKKTYDIAKPEQVVAMSKMLKDYIVRQGLFTEIKGKNYAHVEGWQFAGFLTGLEAIVEETIDMSTDKEIKWKARVHLYHNGKVVSRGDAICSSKEALKKGFDEYAILSMAQTRAIGKAYRNRIGWVMKLAGYQATPSEEMRKGNEEPKDAPRESERTEKKDGPVYYCYGPRGKGCPNGNEEIDEATHAYSMKRFKKPLCRECQKEM